VTDGDPIGLDGQCFVAPAHVKLSRPWGYHPVPKSHAPHSSDY
jgi:hypothetical protein